MMFEQTKIFLNVKRNFNVSLGKLYFLSDVENKLNIYTKGRFLTKNMEFNTSNIFIISHRKIILTDSWNGIGYEYDDNLNFQKTIALVFFSTNLNKGFFRRTDFENNKNYCGAYNFDENEVLWEIEDVTIRLVQGHCFAYPFINTILKLDNLTGRQLWQFSLSSFPKYPGIDKKVEVRKFIGVYNGILWVGLTNFMLVGIDVESGIEVHRILYPAIELPIAEKLRIKKGIRRTPHGLSFGFLDDKVGKIIHIYEAFYFELDLTTLQIKHQDLANQLQGTQSHEMANMKSFDDKYLYYIDGPNCSVGVVNRQTLQVVWQHDFKAEYNTNPLELKHDENGNLYILDSENTLRVFERENDVV